MVVYRFRQNGFGSFSVVRGAGFAASPLSLFFLLACLLSGGQALAMNGDPTSIVRGGRLYDNWHKETWDAPPKENHPAYPATGRFADDPANNWRCSECHGWDYKGSEGTYGKGSSHYTGIKGISGYSGVPLEDVIDLLEDDNHGYDRLLDKSDLTDLAIFVRGGQVDMDRVIDRKSGAVGGDGAKHKDYYTTICAGCHGDNGMSVTTILPLGDVVRENPWKALHKVLNGHPKETMPALRALDMAVSVGLLAYLQTLPPKDLNSSIVRGAHLYDNWFKEKGISSKAMSAPSLPYNRKHPAYPKGSEYADKPRSNWRCKECHGWDYMGNKGAYGKGKHFTGIKGIREMAGASQEKVVTVLKDSNHNYGDLLDMNDLVDLANFVSSGQVDMDTYITRATGMANGDSGAYNAHYATICANCHGKDGTKIRTMPPLGRMAKTNPWEALHRILNGHPDEEMPALRIMDHRILVGLLAFIQTLPTER